MADARTKLAVLLAIQQGQGVAQTCRTFGIHRATYYRWRARLGRAGPEGLEDKPRIAASCPHRTPADVVAMIASLSMEHPAWGCKSLSSYLALDGYEISSPTVQSILKKNGLGKRGDRRQRLAEVLAQGAHLSREQLAFLEKMS